MRQANKNIAYLDETILHNNYTASICWQSENGIGSTKPVSKGSRLIIINASGEQGFVPMSYKYGSLKHRKQESIQMISMAIWSFITSQNVWKKNYSRIFLQIASLNLTAPVTTKKKTKKQLVQR